MNALNLKTRITVKPAYWWPAELKERVQREGKVLYTVRWSRAERKNMRKKKVVPPSVFAERYRVVTTSVIPGPWRNAVAPYLAGIMDAWALPFIEEVDVCKCPQSGVSEAMHNCCAWASEFFPGPAMYVFPDELMAKDNSDQRVQPMFKASRHLSQNLTGKQDDEARLNIKLRNMLISFAWSSSASRLGNKPVRYGFADEYDKWSQPVGGRGNKEHDTKANEPSAKKLLDARMNTYRGAMGLNKVLLASTPARVKGGVWELVEGAQAKFDHWVKCPICGHEQRMHWGSKDSKGGYRLPPDCRDPEKIYAENLATYECAGCADRWDDYTKNRAVALGGWRERTSGLPLMEHLELHNPKRIGFHLPAWISPFIKLSETAKAFLTDLKDFTIHHEAKPWIDRVVHSDIENMLKAVTPLQPQTVPQEAVALTCFIDNQKYDKWYVVRAWSRDETSWLVDFGQILSFEDLTEFLKNAHYPVDGGSGSIMGLWRIAIDTGGGAKYEDMSMTEECYNWISHMRDLGVYVYACKGASKMIPEGFVKIGQPLDRMPSGKSAPSGLKIITLDTIKLKDLFFKRLGLACKGEPMGSYLHSGDDGYYGRYLRHLRAERKVEDADGNISWQQLSADNHLLDCECGCLAQAHQLWPGRGVNFNFTKLTEAPQKAQTPDTKQGPWLGQRTGSWMR